MGAETRGEIPTGEDSDKSREGGPHGGLLGHVGRVHDDVVRRRLSGGRFQVSLVWEGVLVGLVGGLVVAAYRLVLSWAERTVRAITGAAAENPMYVLGWFVVLGVLATIVALLVRWEPDTSGSGIPQVDAEVMDALDMRWPRVLVAKFAEGTLAALGGLSLGREGPSVQLGGMAGKAVSRVLGRGRGEERLLVTCGAGAGMAAAFHAPLTGVMFALEEIHKTFSAPLIISAMTAAVTADYVASQLLGLSPVVIFSLSEYVPRGAYGALVLFGVGMGVIGALHNLGMFVAQDLLARIRWHAPLVRLLVPFILAGVVAFTAPILMDGGDAILELLRRPQGLTMLALAGMLVGKYVFTCVCFGAGTPGGTLFPLVTMGALAGALLGEGFCEVFGLDRVLVLNFMVLGIAGMFAGAIRAPVTAVVLAFELTGSLDALLSLSIVSVIAYVTANLLKVDAYYEHLLSRLLGVSADEAHGRWGAGERQLHSYVVEAGCELIGARISDVAWPKGTLVVTVTRCGNDLVPRGSTELMESDRLLVLFGSDAGVRAERRVRELCRGSLEG